tara:strand:+ start:194 stop:622 length:429 start_codon:yes stop_codon:yes gene_type:complete
VKLNTIQVGHKAIEDFNYLIKSLNLNLDALNKWANSTAYEKIAGIVIDDKNENYKLKKSNIHGNGIFANKKINKGDIVGYVYKNKIRSFLAKYTNHSPIYNAKFLDNKNKKETIMVAFKNIKKNEEILVDYRNQVFNREFYK